MTSLSPVRDLSSLPAVGWTDDVLYSGDGQSCKAHKMILSACSPYFKALLEENPAKHPIIILKDVPFQHLTAILEFMYAGEVNVAQVRITFMRVT